MKIIMYLEHLEKHIALQQRRKNSELKLNDVRKAVLEHLKIEMSYYNIFCCGSLGRGEFGKPSDLDIFIFSEKNEDDQTRLEGIELLSKLIFINKDLGFPKFSNDGMFLKILSFSEMTKSIGRPKDDEKNLFTSRMLMLLESKPLSNEKLYDSQMEKIVDLYFRDNVDRSSFKPLFLLNDLLRFWRTLCLNYETVRNDQTKPFRKKNINLKFSRMLTVFATVLPIIAQNQCSKKKVLWLCKQTPLNRFADGLDTIGDCKLLAEFDRFLDAYEFFLSKKENMLDQPNIEMEQKEEINKIAKEFSTFLYKCLSHPSILEEYKKYLVL